jgi:hypothetical protein
MNRIIFKFKGNELFWKSYTEDPVPRIGEYVAFKDQIYEVNAVLYHYAKHKIVINLSEYPIV